MKYGLAASSLALHEDATQATGHRLFFPTRAAGPLFCPP